jgi:transcriptional regulator with XRE-family HTH domain
MELTSLGEYIETMRAKHPRLSRRQMALEAGLSESLITGIVNKGLGARPETLKALADRWGTPEDYAIMLTLAGHPLPASTQEPSDAGWPELRRIYTSASAENRARIRALARALNEVDSDQADAITPPQEREA